MAQYRDFSAIFVALTTIMGSGSLLAVLLRIVARKKSKIRLGLDDAFAMAALCGFLTFLGLTLWGQVLLKID